MRVWSKLEAGFESVMGCATGLRAGYNLTSCLTDCSGQYSEGSPSTSQLTGAPTETPPSKTPTEPDESHTPTESPTETCYERFWLIGYTSMADRASVHDDDAAYYVEWLTNGAWSPRQLWFVGKNDQGSVVGRHTPFEATVLPEEVRISSEHEETDDWGYWKLGFEVDGEGCDEQTILEEPAASEGPPRTFGSQGVANWEVTRKSQQEVLSRDMPGDAFYDWHRWWLGEETSLNNTYSIRASFRPLLS